MDAPPAAVVPGTATGSSLAAVRALGRRGVRPVVVGPDAPAARSNFCAEVVPAPDPASDLAGYADALLDLAEREAVETVVPAGPADARVLTLNRDLFAERVATPWPGRTQSAVAGDRARLFDVARNAGVPIPSEAGSDAGATVDAPAVADGAPGASVTTSDGGRVLDAGDGAAADGPPGRIAGDRGLLAVFDHGDPVSWFGYRRRRPAADGAPAYRESVRDPDLRDHGLGLLSALEWHGPATVGFARDGAGSLQLRDVRPHFAGALPLALAAGVDLPWHLYRLATGDPPDGPPAYEAGVGCHDLVGEAAHLARCALGGASDRSAAVEAGRVLASLAAAPNFDCLRATDLGPFVCRVDPRVG